MPIKFMVVPYIYLGLQLSDDEVKNITKNSPKQVYHACLMRQQKSPYFNTSTLLLCEVSEVRAFIFFPTPSLVLCKTIALAIALPPPFPN
jgi:hypothetical protein